MTVSSRHGSVLVIAMPDETLRRGVVAITHGYRAEGHTSEHDPYYAGTNVNMLVGLSEQDPLSGIPRMSGLPVSILPATRADPVAMRKSCYAEAG